MKPTLCSIVAWTLLSAAPLPGLAQEARDAGAPGKPAEQGRKPGGQGEAPKEKEQAPVVTEHSMTLNGKAIPYRVSTGYLLLKDEVEGPDAVKTLDEKAKSAASDPLKAKAKIFFVAYTRGDVEPATRPVSFVFNGGPGAASVWLHLGALGPRRVKVGAASTGSPPPYHLLDNASTWLDETDLVFIDPVSTGFSRPVVGESSRSFHGFEEDLKSITQFIRDYITQNNRWLSPKYVIGESYGGTRAAAIAGNLQDRADIYLNGIVVISGVLNWQTIDFRAGNDLSYISFLPSYASAAAYHKRLPDDLQMKSPQELRAEVERFASTEYALGLAQGSNLAEEDRTKLVQKVAGYTGLPVDVIARYNLRIPSGVFRDELLKSENRSIGRFDSRAVGIMTDPDGSNFDPSFAVMRGNFTAGINAYLRSELHFETDLPYWSLANVGAWNFGGFENRYLDVAESLARAMAKNPYLHVWILAGQFDLAVARYGTDYTLRQMRLAPEIKKHLVFTKYEGGHMMYTDEEVLKQLKLDFPRTWDDRSKRSRRDNGEHDCKMTNQQRMLTVTFSLEHEGEDFVRRLEVRARHGRGAGSHLEAELGGIPLVVWYIGVGRRMAAAQAAKLLQQVRPSVVICAGYAGGLQESLEIGAVVVDWRKHGIPNDLEARITTGVVTTIDTVAETAVAKRRLGEHSGAAAVDMESGVLGQLLEPAGVPVIAVRSISDRAADDLPVPMQHWFDLERQAPRPAALVAYLLKHPRKILPFARFVKGLGPARRNLADALCALIPTVGRGGMAGP